MCKCNICFLHPYQQKFFSQGQSGNSESLPKPYAGQRTRRERSEVAGATFGWQKQAAHSVGNFTVCFEVVCCFFLLPMYVTWNEMKTAYSDTLASSRCRWHDMSILGVVHVLCLVWLSMTKVQQFQIHYDFDKKYVFYAIVWSFPFRKQDVPITGVVANFFSKVSLLWNEHVFIFSSVWVQSQF